MLGNISEVTADLGNSRETSVISPGQTGCDDKTDGGF